MIKTKFFHNLALCLSLRLALLLALPVALLFATGCSGGNGFTASSQNEVVVTDKNISPENPYVIPRYEVQMGFVTLSNVKLDLDKSGAQFDGAKYLNGSKYTLVGQYKVVDSKQKNLSQKDFKLEGYMLPQGNASMYPDLATAEIFEKARARITCLDDVVDGACHSVIVDFYVKRDGKILAAQIQIGFDGASKTPVTKNTNENDKDDSGDSSAKDGDEHDVDSHEGVGHEDEAGLYVGTLYDDPEPLFDDGTDGDEAQSKGVTKPAVPTASPKGNPPPVEPQVKPVKPPLTTPAPAPVAPAPAPAPVLPKLNPEDGKPKTPAPKPAPAPVRPPPSTPAPPVPVAPPAPKPKPVTPAPQTPVVVAPNKALPQPVPAPVIIPIARNRDQAVGMAAGGRLENPTNLFEESRSNKSAYLNFLYPQRERYYGTYELAQSLIRMSTFLNEMDPGDRLTIGDMSKKAGGRIEGSQHKSHQNGLDADISFPRKNDKTPEFTDIVQGNGVISDVRLDVFYRLLEFAQVSLHTTDRVFAATPIKRALCKMAHEKNLLDDSDKGRAVEVLRRIRPEDSHRKHFHMRIRCSTQQPRCRMMAEPPAGSGCKGL